MSKKSYKELQEEAAALGLKHVGVSYEDLEQSIAEAKGNAPKPKPKSDASIEEQVLELGRKTADRLNSERKERVIIAKDPLNKDDNYVVVGINGYNYQIEREKPVELPISVIRLLEQSHSPSYNVRLAR